MVSDQRLALRALHEALVAARNIGLTTPNTASVTDIVDSLEPIPLWIADPDVDRTGDVLGVFNALASEYPECRMAANTAAGMRAESAPLTKQ